MACSARSRGSASSSGPASRGPTPRLRWSAADLLIRSERASDRELAQALLRKILLAESFRGRDPAHAAAADLLPLDPMAIAATGFATFVNHYLRTGDPQTEDT